MKPRKQKNNAWLQKLYDEGQLTKKPEVSQEPPPTLYPDLYWIWDAYCFLSERRSTGPNGPNPISTSDMAAYIDLTGRHEDRYRRQILRFIPPMDRVFLKDFYDKQAKELEKIRRQGARKGR